MKKIFASLFLAMTALAGASAGAHAAAESGATLESFLPFPLPYNIADDETLNARVDASVRYQPLVSAPRWVVPATNLPAEVRDQRSNNNDAIAWYNGRLYLAWRTAPSHFASKKTRLYVVSSDDFGKSWRYETQIHMKSDLREPFFLNFKGRLILSCFQAGTNPAAFQPKRMWRIEKLASGAWSEPELWGQPGEIPWELKVRNGRAWLTSYKGPHYSGDTGIDLHFQVSDDGTSWSPVDPAHPAVYHGGVSEVGFDFDGDGNLWGVTRNEDGDQSGFGSHVVSARASDLGHWTFPARSNPERFDSPRMFRHGNELYLIARRDVGGPFDSGWRFLPGDLRKYAIWVAYSKRPKRTALYRLDTVTRSVVHVMDLPSAGDTAFASIVRLDPDTYLVANYTSPLEHVDRDWIWGQLSPEGTRLYFLLLKFEPETDAR